MKKLNNKGYLLVEIIVASVLAMGIAYFLVRLTINFSKTDEDIYRSISWTNDKNIITNMIMEDTQKYEVVSIENPNANTIEFTYSDTTTDPATTIVKELEIDRNNNQITYGTDINNIDNGLMIDNINFGELDYFEKNESLGYTKIIIPIKSLYSDEDYGIKLFIY